jgi:hypothetical protein
MRKRSISLYNSRAPCKMKQGRNIKCRTAYARPLCCEARLTLHGLRRAVFAASDSNVRTLRTRQLCCRTQERYAGLLRLAGLKINGLTDVQVTVGFKSMKVRLCQSSLGRLCYGVRPARRLPFSTSFAVTSASCLLHRGIRIPRCASSMVMRRRLQSSREHWQFIRDRAVSSCSCQWPRGP